MEELISLFKKRNNNFSSVNGSVRYNILLLEKINQATTFLPKNSKLSEKIYCVMNNLTVQPGCKVCSGKVSFKGYNFGYSTFCRLQCAVKDSEIRKCISAKKLIHYKDPIKKEQTLQKFKQTSLLKFGTENPAQSLECREKQEQTTLKRYGVKSGLQTEWARKLSIETNHTPEANQKRDNTNLIRYNHKNPFQMKENRLKRRLSRYKKMLASERMKNIEMLTPLEEFKGVGREYLYMFRCRICLDIFESHLDWGNIPRCFNCFPMMTGKSGYELQVACFLESLGVKNICLNTRSVISPKELDIYLPDYKIAIEFNGLWSHSEIQGRKNRVYHLEKTNLCKEKGIQLIHIFEDEWVQKQKIVESIIKHKLGLITNKIYARNCKVIQIEASVCYEFLSNNHVNTPSVRKFNFGLYYKNELVYVLSLGINKNNQYEVKRSCSKIDTSAVGGFDKLVKFAIKSLDIKSMISYVDQRYFDGRGYRQWKFTRITEPSYDYVNFKDYRRENRQTYMKNKIKEKFPEVYQESSTEWAMMQELNISPSRKMFDRIWNCGLLVFEYKT